MARRSSSRALTHVVLNKFQGGINSMPDKVQINLGYSVMARNVEWQVEGGFYVRKGVGPLVYGEAGQEMPPTGNVPVRFFHYVRDPAVTSQFVSQYLVANENGTIQAGIDYGPGPVGAAQGTWVTAQAGGADLVTDGPPTFTAWDTNVYISLGEAAISGFGKNMYRYDGTAVTALGQAWANDYAAPVGGNMPLARYTAAWAERMWVACEVGADDVIRGSSIRWSHPGKPEDWAESDQITVGQAGDIITAIAPMRDMLVIFKRSSMYALLGSGASNFRVVELSGTIGSTGEFTVDNQGSVVFWDGTLGCCRFDGKNIDNIFQPLRHFMQAGAGGSITRCGGVVTDGEKVYVTTDFVDFYGDELPGPPSPTPGIQPGTVPWQSLVDAGITWGAMAGFKWLQVSVEFFNIVWVFRPNAGWTSYTIKHEAAPAITMLGQIRSRVNPTGDVISNRRIVYGLNSGSVPLFLSDRFDGGVDDFGGGNRVPIASYYMTPWLHGGLPAQIKRWKAPRIIQEADDDGVLLVDVFYDFNYDFLRRTLRTAVVEPLSVDSYVVGKPGTIGRAKAVLLIIRPEFSAESAPRHWGVSSITIPLHPKVLR